MKTFTLSLILMTFLFNTIAFSQHFKELATDADDVPTFSADARSLSMATDLTLDSIWFRITFWDTINANTDYGFRLGLDTDLDTTNGIPFVGVNDTVLLVDYNVLFLNNKFFPPTLTNLTDSASGLVTQAFAVNYPDDYTVEFRFQLSLVDDDTTMNLAFASGTFDDMMYDDMPDGDYMRVRSDTSADTTVTSIENLPEQVVKLYPNPVKEELQIQSSEKIASMIVYDVQGIQMMELNPVGSTYYLEMTDWTSGMYTILLRSTTGQTTHKRIIKL